ncbi:MAG: heavy metal translocating P-type ATPase metal-binding domain-containing protein [Roseivirga sp.]
MSVIEGHKEAHTATNCYHCGDACEAEKIVSDEKDFCCQGCKTVYEILSENELCNYYDLEESPGITFKDAEEKSIYDFLDNQAIKAKMLQFSGDNYEKVTFSVPAIHCSSCIWLLENLDRLHEGVIDSKVDFSNKTVTAHYQPQELSLRQMAEMLDSIGYAPLINLNEDGEEKRKEESYDRQLIIKMGVAGFCFGNIMLLSFPDYLGLTGIEKSYQSFFRYLNVLLALPVVFYAGADYFVSAFKSIRQRYANIDIPIALGVSVLFLRSFYEVAWGIGPGYFDSLVGLIFYLLIGKWFQNKTYRSMSFDRDYKSYFPLAVLKQEEAGLVSTQVTELTKGDEIAMRNGEIIPADAILIDERAAIDYSFITGESEAVQQKKGDYLYAGGRHTGPMARMIVQKEVSQSYLTRLWNDDAFSKEDNSRSMIDRISKYFTLTIIGIAVLAGVYWQFVNPTNTWLVFTAVLIVACPCALALVTPFTSGSVMRVLGRNKFYLKNAAVVEKFSTIDSVVFDKTGTITHTTNRAVSFSGDTLSAQEKALVLPVVMGSTHPLSRLIKEFLGETEQNYLPESFTELPGKGIDATVAGVRVLLGSAKFVGEAHHAAAGLTHVYLKIGNMLRGSFQVKSQYRDGIETCVQELARDHELAVLSGDNNNEASALRKFFPETTAMKFNQSPESKLREVKTMQEQGHAVVMLGDGLNDAGALKQSDIGIAVTEDIAAFSPASDAILEASALAKLNQLLRFGKSSRKVIWASFVLSFLYNVVGISLAVMGVFTPLIAAILMPLSSISVVFFTTFGVHLFAKKFKLN